MIYCQGGGYFGGFDDGLGQGVDWGDHHQDGEGWDVSHPTTVVDDGAPTLRVRPRLGRELHPTHLRRRRRAGAFRVCRDPPIRGVVGEMTAGHGSPDAVQMLLDQHAVIDLCNRYALALDQRDWAALERCFVPDAVFHRPTGGALVGFAAILARSRGALDALDASQHLIGSHVVEVDGDQARSICYFHAQHVRAAAIEGPLLVIAGSYHDHLCRTSEGWRISERRQDVSWRSGNSGVIVR